MAGAYVAQVNNGASGLGGTITQAVTYNAGDFVVVWVFHTGVTTTVTVSDGTHTYTERGSAGEVVSALTHRSRVFTMAAATAGAVTVTATFGSNRNNRRIVVVRYTGVRDYQTALANGQIGAATTTDAVTTGDMTPTSAPAFLAALTITASGTSTVSAGTGFTDRGNLANWDAIGSFSSLLEDKALATTSAVPGTFTIGTSRDTLTHGIVLTDATLVADPGVYTLTGSAASVGRMLLADAGSYAVTGPRAALQVGRDTSVSQTDLTQPMIPSPRDPLVNERGEINPVWWRWLNDTVWNGRLGGIAGPTITEVSTGVTEAKEIASTAEVVASAAGQAVISTAQSVQATISVAQAAALPGASSIPTPPTSLPIATGIDP